jgi:ring-1,2-phenylacetyl-CoA epoxidase subunit PaaE
MNEKIKLRVKGITQETADTITIHFSQPEEKLNYLSGQYLTLISEINGKEVRRAYSLCSSSYTDQDISVRARRRLTWIFFFVKNVVKNDYVFWRL